MIKVLQTVFHTSVIFIIFSFLITFNFSLYFKVSNPEQCINSTDVNAADNTSDFLDEAAERAAFQEAVAKWRNSGTRNEVEVEGKGESCNTSTKKKVDKNSDSGMWHNPFMSMTDELEDSVSKESVKTKHENKCDQESMTNYSTESDRAYSVSTEVKNSFFQGSLDEVAEHEVIVL